MSRRWIAYALAVFAVALVTLFPLRLAMDLALGREALLSARQVAGTVWAGRVGDAMLGRERLGSFDVGLRPLSLLLGRTEVEVERLGDPDGPLSGRFFLAGTSEGVADLDGRVAVADLVAPLPIEALRFEAVDALFDGEGCVRAQGRITALPATAIAPLSGELSGPLSCAPDGRVEALLTGARGAETVALHLGADGEIVAAITITGAPPMLGEALEAAGFERTDTGWTLATRGRLD
ncbi:type II secretion system protein N [Sphingomicrobium astaxanthinifaciens]|uniref:type II secretion system protein N n=1 Tax=Sphingomicrobium astaxanthinifaciens TaxID=1227949 RepID=UPI001FCA9B7B|nr:type II secretion system protein N [Sphingomicrobium astaxanthinifaciens]MCJ7421080.1 type II secretion system protein N [Sphingomicrobium astaxanthinifaciens]